MTVTQQLTHLTGRNYFLVGPYTSRSKEVKIYCQLAWKLRRSKLFYWHFPRCWEVKISLQNL